MVPSSKAGTRTVDTRSGMYVFHANIKFVFEASRNRSRLRQLNTPLRVDAAFAIYVAAVAAALYHEYRTM